MIRQLVKHLASSLGIVVKRRRPGTRRSKGHSASSAPALDHETLMQLVHGADVFRDFPYHEHPFDGQGWGSDSPAFEKLISKMQPSLVIEVGSWKGGSALKMAEALRKQNHGVLLCIDTWLGALEFWENQDDPDRFQSLKCRHGYPQVYFTFLANVCHACMCDVIVPFPLPSSSAAFWILRRGISADLVYLDGSHEEEDVYQDLLDYFEIIRPGGIVFGDDWEWSGVQTAVRRFARENGLEITHLDDKWLLKKGGSLFAAP